MLDSAPCLLIAAFLCETFTGLLVCSASILAQAAEPLQQSGVLSLQLFDHALSGALIHHRLVLDVLGPEPEERQ